MTELNLRGRTLDEFVEEVLDFEIHPKSDSLYFGDRPHLRMLKEKLNFLQYLVDYSNENEKPIPRQNHEFYSSSEHSDLMARIDSERFVLPANRFSEITFNTQYFHAVTSNEMIEVARWALETKPSNIVEILRRELANSEEYRENEGESKYMRSKFLIKEYEITEAIFELDDLKSLSNIPSDDDFELRAKNNSIRYHRYDNVWNRQFNLGSMVEQGIEIPPEVGKLQIKDREKTREVREGFLRKLANYLEAIHRFDPDKGCKLHALELMRKYTPTSQYLLEIDLPRPGALALAEPLAPEGTLQYANAETGALALTDQND